MLNTKTPDPSLCCLQKTHLRLKDPQTRTEWIKKDIPTNRNEEKAGGSNTHIRQSRF